MTATRMNQAAFAKALAVTTKTAPTTGGALPALAGIHLQHDGDTLTLTATNLETTITTRIEATGAPFTALYPARILNDITKTLPDGTVTLTHDPNEPHQATVTSGNYTATIRLLPLDDYPNLDRFTVDGHTVTIPGETLADALKQTSPAASTDDARPILTGIHIEPEGDGLRLVATDSYRLAVRDMPGTTLTEDNTTVLVPSDPIRKLQNLLTADDVQVTISDRQASFTTGNTTITTRLIEGAYPNYRGLIPASLPNQLTIEREAFIDTLKRIKLLARDTNTPVRINMAPEETRIWTSTQGVGDATETIDATYTGDPLEIGFNPDYLIAGLESATSDTVTLEATDPMKPAVIRDTTNDWLYLIMPVRTN